ncbi:MAG: DNA alkylation repair protein [Planctomycetota bacterium]
MSRKRSDVSPDRLAELHAGAPTRELVEQLAMDEAELARQVMGNVPRLAEALDADDSGTVDRIRLAADVLIAELGATEARKQCASSSSDVMRGWGAFVVGRQPTGGFATRLRQMAKFADDPHFGVREFAWLALRPHIAEDVGRAIQAFIPWTRHRSANRRRFAVEATRPRGVWCKHLAPLRTDPTPGLPLLQPLHDDPSKYVRDSVANWLNDAAKDHPQWVREVVADWGQTDASAYTVRRALRTIKR